MYSTVESVRDALTPGGVSNDKSTAAGLTNVQIQDSIAEADATIENYLSNRYVVPIVDPVPTTVQFWSRSIAAYLATLTKRKSSDLAETDPVVRRFNLAMSQLAAVQASKAQLSIPELASDAIQSEAQIQNQYEGTMFWPGDYSVGPGLPYPGMDRGCWNDGRIR